MRLLLLSFSLFFLTACGTDYLLDQRYALDKETWTYDQILGFEADIPDTLSIYNLWIDIEHHKDFPFQNLYTRITTGFPDQRQIEQLLSFELADKFGNWQGDCSGQYCSYRIPIQEGAFFNQTGKHTFQLEQYMRADSIPHVRAIGFQIEKTGLRR